MAYTERSTAAEIRAEILDILQNELDVRLMADLVDIDRLRKRVAERKNLDMGNPELMIEYALAGMGYRQIGEYVPPKGAARMLWSRLKFREKFFMSNNPNRLNQSAISDRFSL